MGHAFLNSLLYLEDSLMMAQGYKVNRTEKQLVHLVYVLRKIPAKHKCSFPPCVYEPSLKYWRFIAYNVHA